jgi:Mn2+/Fe2+ NRAMP family transporter
MKLSRMLPVVGPGLLVAATGVGAGDLATGAFAGSRLGPAVLWAVALGALIKFGLSEGLARWQLATGETVLAGAVHRLGRPVRLVFPLYLLPWSFFVGAALISACGVTFQAMVPLPVDPVRAKLVWGLAHSLLGILLVWTGGYRLIEKVMAACIAVMFAAVILTAVLLRPDPVAVLTGLVWPRIPQLHAGGMAWTIALMGGVGGTLTVICYGYWIREKGRTSPADLRTCRIDLAVGYAATAVFGMAMVVIASGLVLDGSGVGLILGLAGQLEQRIGLFGRWVFLIGAWAAVFSSLLGVWQSVPYVFADFWQLVREKGGGGGEGGEGNGEQGYDAGRGEASSSLARVVDTTGRPYRVYLLALALIPLLQVSHSFRDVQKLYAVVGAAFLPLLAVALLLLNGRRRLVGALRNGPAATALLTGAVLLSAAAGILGLLGG